MGDGPTNSIDLFTGNTFGRQWALFDANAKFTYDESTRREEFVATFTEQPIVDLSDKSSYYQAYAAIKAASKYAHADFSSGADREVLQERLKKLGYLA